MRSERRVMIASVVLLAMVVGGAAVTLRLREGSAPKSDPNGIAAQQLAERLMTSLRVGAGWIRVPTAHVQAVGATPEGPMPHMVDITRFWVAPGPWLPTLAWMITHPPPGLSPAKAFQATSLEPTRELDYSPIPGGQGQIQIFAQPSADGKVDIRADVEVSWRPTRSAAEMASPRLRTAVITVLNYSRRPSLVLAHRVVTNPAEVRELVDAFNQLQVETSDCSLGGEGPMYELRLSGGAPTVTISGTNCGDTVTVGARSFPQLTDNGLQAVEIQVLGTTENALLQGYGIGGLPSH